MPECALPVHLKNKLHNDWPWPFNRIKRSSNAYGPRCGIGREGYKPWPPKLIEGHGVARWEIAGGSSIIEIPDLAERTVNSNDVYGKKFTVIERNPGHKAFNEEKTVCLMPPEHSHVADEYFLNESHPARPAYQAVQIVDPNYYSPSALQKFSRCGWMRLDPSYTAHWAIIKWRELPALRRGERDSQEDDTVLFYRSGYRPDHVDAYYNGPKIIPIGYVGLKWE